MKNTYVSERQFMENCPYASAMTGYVYAVMPSGSSVSFCKGEKKTGSDSYRAEFDVYLRNGVTGSIVLLCTPAKDTYTIKELSRSETLQSEHRPTP